MSDIVKMEQRSQGLEMRTMGDIETFAVKAFMSGILKKQDKESDEQRIAKGIIAIQYGAEIGIGPMQALNGIYIVEGSPAMGAGLMASLIKRSGRYNYRVLRHNSKGCEIEFFDNGQPCGKSIYTMEDASKQGLSQKYNWKKFPKNMVFARALSNGARWYCADVFLGAIYTPDELSDKISVAPDSVMIDTGSASEGEGLKRAHVSQLESSALEAEFDVDPIPEKSKVQEPIPDARPVAEVSRPAYCAASPETSKKTKPKPSDHQDLIDDFGDADGYQYGRE